MPPMPCRSLTKHLRGVLPEQWAQLRFGWHPSVQRLELHWNAPQIWQAATEEA